LFVYDGSLCVAALLVALSLSVRASATMSVSLSPPPCARAVPCNAAICNNNPPLGGSSTLLPGSMRYASLLLISNCPVYVVGVKSERVGVGGTVAAVVDGCRSCFAHSQRFQSQSEQAIFEY
jgi:hypothetical protein